MAQTQTQVSLKNNNIFTSSTIASYSAISNSYNYTEVAVGTNGINNVIKGNSVVNPNISVTSINTYGLVFMGTNVYGTAGNTLSQYSTQDSGGGISFVRSWDISTSATSGTVLPYTNNATTKIPATTVGSQTNNYNTTSFPITVESTGNTITATGTFSYTVTSVFGTSNYLDADGTNIYALLPDSRILSISITANVPTCTIIAGPILSNLSTSPAFGLAYGLTTSTGFLYSFDGYSQILNSININDGSFAPLTGTGGSNQYQTSSTLYYAQGSGITEYLYNGINYLLISASSGLNNPYYSIDAIQLSVNLTTRSSTNLSGTTVTSNQSQIAFKYSTIFSFQEVPISMTISTNTNILYTVSSYIPTGGGNPVYNYYQFSITISGAPICFLKGTYIYTNKGYELIETLKKGDLVNTFKDNYVAIDTIVEEEIIHDARQERNKCQLYKLDYPEYPQLLKELYITGAHSILVGKLTEKQKAHIIQDYGKVFATDLFDRLPAYIDERAKVHDESGKYTIYHLALENENNFSNYGIFANGLLVESLSKNDCVNRLF